MLLMTLAIIGFVLFIAFGLVISLVMGVVVAIYELLLSLFY